MCPSISPCLNSRPKLTGALPHTSVPALRIGQIDMVDRLCAGGPSKRWMRAMQQNRVTCWRPGAGWELGDARGGRKGDWTGPTRVCRAVMNGKTGHVLVNGRCEMACNCTQDYHRPGNCPAGYHPCPLPSGVSEGEGDSEISVPKGLASWLLWQGSIRAPCHRASAWLGWLAGCRGVCFCSRDSVSASRQAGLNRFSLPKPTASRLA